MLTLFENRPSQKFGSILFSMKQYVTSYKSPSDETEFNSIEKNMSPLSAQTLLLKKDF